MANDSSKNVVVAEQLEALAVAAKNYTQNEIAKGDISAANFTLDTVPSTVEGAMWLDNSSDEKLVIYHNNQHYYFPLAVLPKILSVNVAPSSVAVMQGQSATATVSAVGNDAVTGLSYGLSGAPTWITISDDVILIQPSDNDLGIANVQVYAQDTGSDAMSAAILRAEAKLHPIIQSLSVVPPAVTVQQGQSAIAGISAVANAAVTGLSYSLNGASSWLTLTDNSIIVAPTDNDLGSNTVDVIAYDTNSSASAATQFVATAALRPIISSVSVNPPTVAAAQGESTTATISAVANAAVTGLSYSLEGQPPWMNLSGSVILMTPTENDSGSAAVTVTAQDTGSTAHAETVFNADILEPLPNLAFTLKDTLIPADTTATIITGLHPPTNDSTIKVLYPTELLVKGIFYDETSAAVRTGSDYMSPPGNYNITLQAATADGKRTTQTVVPIKITKATPVITQYVNGTVGTTITVQKATSGNAELVIQDSVKSHNNTYDSVVVEGDTVTLQGYVPKNATLTASYFKPCHKSGNKFYNGQASFVLTYPKKSQTTVSTPTTPATIEMTHSGNGTINPSNVIFSYKNINQSNADSICTVLSASLN